MAIKNMKAFAVVFCNCGWEMAQTEDLTVYCNNPKCKRRAKLYQLAMELTEIEPIRDERTSLAAQA